MQATVFQLKSCIKIDTLGLNGVYVSITNCAYVYCSYVRNHAWLVWSFATSLETSLGRLPNRLDVRAGVGEDAREWLLEVAIGLFTRHKD
ncbi:hypothetical protein T12_929 [Trichinella patagoniensis]|uniref:Uncharacterized protein n=1 Tax=Trichinella patagoniensis TaxID=990121 RepID=A0A0V0ZIH1_9BILA|nr:hypothetical protein T12_929 [Trichinella patagoniensis]